MKESTRHGGSCCKRQQWSVLNPKEAEVTQFFIHQFQTKQITYGSFNTYRSALARRVLRPPARRYNYIWDPQRVLSFLEQKYPNDNLSLNELSKKTVTLLALITGHRIKTLARIRVENIIISMENIQVLIADHIKTTGTRAEQPCLMIPYFKGRPGICAASALTTYIQKTISIRNQVQDYLFLSTRSPYNTATTSTISRWIRKTLEEAGLTLRSSQAIQQDTLPHQQLTEMA
ncbi:hypothetical protein NQ314_012186 [Rhamnusium bicolor]|uniref:Tyr recombinase domain-containing protein n=1 Tax=Rhamnusium bicolor TaxID=1586634 RepID=A0AAV8XDN5_9CUCU|nr:hypothetical protein NQ314_012186 [Rhamnusium bicolor]